MRENSRAIRALGVALEIAVPIAVLVLWGLLSANSTSFYFPPLLDVFRAFGDTWLFERVADDVLPSLGRLFAGYGIAVVAAVVIGVALGSSRTLGRMVDPVVQFLRAIPAPVLIPKERAVSMAVGSTSRTP